MRDSTRPASRRRAVPRHSPGGRRRDPILAAGLALLVGCGKDPDRARTAPVSGQKHFEVFCAACHHAEGLGMERAGPPLAGSPWVAGPEGRLIRIVLDGVRGAIAVGDRTYELEMPGFGRILTNAQIASLLSHVRGRFGAPSPPITPEAVSGVRAETRDRDAYWTAGELLEVR